MSRPGAEPFSKPNISDLPNSMFRALINLLKELLMDGFMNDEVRGVGRQLRIGKEL